MVDADHHALPRTKSPQTSYFPLLNTIVSWPTRALADTASLHPIIHPIWEPILSGEAYRVLPCHCPSRLSRQRPPIPFIIGCHTLTMLGSDSPSDEDGVLCAGVPPLLEPWQAS